MPSDPVWKRDYSGSVQRLVRDGVDVPLASLFVHAARAVPPDAEGAARARSATEEFLFRRLETLVETKGRFVLRFLAEDVGKCLDQVLDAILRTLSGRRGSNAL